VALSISLPLAAYMFVTRAGYPHLQATFEALLFAIDGTVVVYLIFLMKKGRQAVQDANRKLRSANEEITRSMARTREAIDLAPDAFFQADLNARFSDVNQAACRLLGYDRDELLGKTIVDIIPPEDVSRLAATCEYLLSPGTVQVAEWTQLRKDGTPVPVEVSSNILADGRWQAFVRDISERKRIERALQESEERFRLTIDEAPIGMALMALDGRFVRVNRALCEIVGYSSDELTGLTFQAVTHPDNLDADRARRSTGSWRDSPIPAREALRPQGQHDRRYPAQCLDSLWPRWRTPLPHHSNRRHYGAQACGGSTPEKRA
jgi:PAS domain S-box-containing protein